jgi:regulator of protease activity HflC (stomatin/prohibitin superfamily)
MLWSLMTVFLIVTLVAVGLIVIRSVVVVPPGFFYVVERLGRFDRALTPGLHVVPPFICRVSARLPAGDQILDVPPLRCTTRDGSDVTCTGTVTFRVVDPAAAVSNVADYKRALGELAARSFARAIGDVEAVAAPTAPANALAELEAAVGKIGLALVAIHPQVTLPDHAVAALASQVAAERDERVARWLASRGERLGRDGRPTDAQRAAYDEWVAAEVRANAREIEAARQLAAAPPPAPRAHDETPPGARLTIAVARTTMAPGSTGRVEADGREWPARNVSAAEIASGFRCAVDRQEGETLLVRAL